MMTNPTGRLMLTTLGAVAGPNLVQPTGRLAEAEKIVKADLPAAEAEANVAQLKRMLSRKDKENARAEVGKMPI